MVKFRCFDVSDAKIKHTAQRGRAGSDADISFSLPLIQLKEILRFRGFQQQVLKMDTVYIPGPMEQLVTLKIARLQDGMGQSANGKPEGAHFQFHASVAF